MAKVDERSKELLAPEAQAAEISRFEREIQRLEQQQLDQGDFKESLARLVLKSVEVRDGEVVATIGL